MFSLAALTQGEVEVFAACLTVRDRRSQLG